VTNETSFDNIDLWLGIAKGHSPMEAGYLLVGNKSDIVEPRPISFYQGQTKANDIGAIAYIETSALTGEGCDLLLEQLRGFARSKPIVLQEQERAEPIVTPFWAPRCC
jgi:GTPase SAR1 family protein